MPLPPMSSPKTQPDMLGHWGPYGGRFVPETLMAPLEELTEALSVCERRWSISVGTDCTAAALCRSRDPALLR
jgi:hypothetical protein